MSRSRGPYGLLAEFRDPQTLLEAVRQARREGYRRMDAFSPYPVDGLAEALGVRATVVPLIVLVGGLLGGAGAYALQYYLNAVDYPINVGGRPLHSAPSFIPITFELTILAAALAGVLGMLALNGLPHPHHPVFNVPRFALASRDRFFLCIEASDGSFDLDRTRRFLESLSPVEVSDIEY
jgi:ActD protein